MCVREREGEREEQKKRVGNRGRERRHCGRSGDGVCPIDRRAGCALLFFIENGFTCTMQQYNSSSGGRGRGDGSSSGSSGSSSISSSSSSSCSSDVDVDVDVAGVGVGGSGIRLVFALLFLAQRHSVERHAITTIEGCISTHEFCWNLLDQSTKVLSMASIAFSRLTLFL